MRRRVCGFAKSAKTAGDPAARKQKARMPGKRSKHAADDGTVTLDRAATGATVRVIRVGGGRRLIHRLAALGLVPGATVTVTRPRGPAIVAVGGANVAVGHQAARVIEIEELTE